MDKRISEFHQWWAEEPYGLSVRAEHPLDQTEAALMAWSAHWEEIEELRKRIRDLEGQHKGLVIQNAILRQRPDLPVERLPVARNIEELIEMILRYQTVLHKIQDYPEQEDCECVACQQCRMAREALSE